MDVTRTTSDISLPRAPTGNRVNFGRTVTDRRRNGTRIFSRGQDDGFSKNKHRRQIHIDDGRNG